MTKKNAKKLLSQPTHTITGMTALYIKLMVVNQSWQRKGY